MTLFISSSGQEKSPYTVSRSTSLGQAPSMCTIASVFSSLAMHARTSPSYLTISLFLRLSPPPSSLYAPIVRSLVRTQTNREGRTRIGIRIRVHEWRQDPRRHVTGAPLLCRREFAPDEAALRQQTARGEQTGSSRPLYTTLHIARSSGSRPVDVRRSTQSVFDC